ncbi:MAG: hypothetical protein WKG07_05350 [Hymenobacter sp.]
MVGSRLPQPAAGAGPGSWKRCWWQQRWAGRCGAISTPPPRRPRTYSRGGAAGRHHGHLQAARAAQGWRAVHPHHLRHRRPHQPGRCCWRPPPPPSANPATRLATADSKGMLAGVWSVYAEGAAAGALTFGSHAQGALLRYPSACWSRPWAL